MTWINHRKRPLSLKRKLVPAYTLMVAAGLCATASAVDKTYPYFRFTQTQLRGNSSMIQLAEFQLIKSGVPLDLTGVIVTNPGGNFPGGEPPAALIDGNLGSKWLDFNKKAVVFQFPDGPDGDTDPDPVTIDAYNFATANDADERDPVSWIFEGSLDGVNWDLIDLRTNYPTTTDRFTYQTPFLLPSGAVVGTFTAAKKVILNGDPVELAWTTVFADQGANLAPGVGAVAANDATNVTPPSDSDTTYTLTASGSGGDAESSLVVRTVAGGSVTFRYVRFTPTKLRDDNAANSIQLSEFYILDGATALTPVAATNPGGNNPGGGGEGPDKAIDGNFGTKWLDFNKKGLVIDLGAPVEFDHYSFVTANDAPERDPMRWLLEGSNDGSNWTLIENFTGLDFPLPSARNALSQDIPLPGSSLTPAIRSFLSDAPKLVAGEPAVLSWDVAGATTVTIAPGVGTVATSGSVTVNPTVDTTYTITANGPGSNSSTATANIVIVSPSITTINYANFDAAGDELSLLGLASVVNDFANIPLPGDVKRLRLTPDQGSRFGTAWFRKRLDFSTGFQSFFDLQFNSMQIGGDGADGMSFMIQDTPSGTGNLLTVLAEQGLPERSLNIKFDSYDNGDDDPSAAFVQVLAGTTVLATANLLNFPGLQPLPGVDDLSTDGGTAAPYRVRVDYVPGDLDIYFNDVLVVNSVNVDLVAIGAVNASGKGYTGFAARTGGAFEAHDVTRWTLSEGPPPAPLVIKSSSFNFGTDQLTLTWGSTDTRTYKITSSTDLADWSTVLATGIQGATGLEETSTTVPFTQGGRAFFRVEEE
jgi:hypothetical protein